MSFLPFLKRLPHSSNHNSSKNAINVSFIRILVCTFGIAILLILITCFTVPTNNSSYHSKLLENMENAKRFEDFTDALFRYEVTSDSITTAYSIKNPDKWDIPTLEPRITTFSYKDYLKESTDNTPDKTLLFVEKCLSRYDFANLSEDEQLTYSLLKDYIQTNSALSEYSFYEGLLGSSTGIQTNLPVTLGEYPLRTESDVKIYLELLTQIPAYFEDIISYEKRRLELGYNNAPFVTVSALNSTNTMIAGFQNGDNSFIDTFDERITQIESLSQKDINKYRKLNQHYVEKYIIPSYEMVVDYLKSILSTTKSTPQTTTDNKNKMENSKPNNTTDYQHRSQTLDSNITTAVDTIDTSNILSYMDENTSYGICTLPKGKDYYSLLTKQTTGSNRPLPELISITEQSLKNALSTVLNTALTNQEAYFYYCEHPLESYYQSPEAILENLSLMIREDYPILSNSPTYEIKTVSDSLAGSLSPAFYMIPTIDDYKNNTIYINPLYTNEENGNLFPTLAHEGFPGHLYQTVYFNERDPSNIRQMLNYLGYVEGWATYVEIDSLTFLDYPIDDNLLCKLYQSDIIINLALCARIDMGVNYEGWTLADTRAFFEEQGFNSYYAQDVYAYVVEAPTNYLSYYIGYLEIMDIKDAYQRQELEHYSEKEFHQKLLDVGPADFDTVRKYVLKH